MYDTKQNLEEYLLNQTVKDIYLNDDQSIIYFVRGDDKVVRIETDADCCSETWFADIIDVDCLIEKRYSPDYGLPPINEIIILDLPTPIDARSRQEEDVAYGFQFKTDRGLCTFVYRNSSNGYYGGSLDAPTFMNEKLDVENLTKIEGDYSA